MDELRLQMTEDSDDHKYLNEAHLLNTYDYQGDIPEYRPFSFNVSGFTPLATWKKSDDPNKMFEPVENQTIETTKDFLELSDKNYTVYLEVQDNNSGKTSVFQLPTMDYLKVDTTILKNKKTQREDLCYFRFGDLDDRTGHCTVYMWIHDICITINKHKNGWGLDDSVFGTLGCAY